VVEEAIAEIGIGFLFAPLYHGAMKHAGRARQEIGLRSIFNMLGPLTNPAAANCQLIGVFAPELTEMFARALQLLGATSALVVHGHDGLDEITVCDQTRVSQLKDGLVRTFDLDPEPLLGRTYGPEALAGGDPAENAAITRAVLQGEAGGRRDIVCLNAAAALVAADKAADFKEGLEKAAAAIDSGAALEKLDRLVAYTQENG
jgi:anthranilate phosphoribosyltransferase